MAQNARRRRSILITLVALIIVILLLLGRCSLQKPAPTPPEAHSPPADRTGPVGTGTPAPVEASPPDPVEVLTPATLTAPGQITAGAAFTVAWSGPDNRGDFITIVKTDAPAAAHGHYRDTSEGTPLELTAPMEPGVHELRYVTGRSHTILARVPVEVVAATATLDAAAEVVLGSTLSVAWTGPDNRGDYVTIVPRSAPDDHYGDYVNTDKGSPVILTAPTAIGDAELRYVSGQGRQVLARRPITVVAARVTLSAPAEAIAGSTIDVVWTGPDNNGDYITLVPRQMPDGQWENYTNTSQGSPMSLLVPIMEGDAELRYMTGQGHRVLARRPIKIVAARVTLSAPVECTVGAQVSVVWTGPNYPGDYITIVTKATADGGYGDYANTSAGSPLTVTAPSQAGNAEIRYMTGQGGKVLARIPIQVVPR